MNGPLALRALAAAAALAGAALPAAAQASKADAFEGKVQPVSGQLYQKAGRFEVTLGGLLSLNDAFFTKYFAGVKAGYHFSEYLSLHAQLAGGAAVKTGSTEVCPVNAGCHPATSADLHQVPGHLNMIAGLELQWSPVYGKLNVFSERVAHFDLSILGGPDWISYDQVLSATDATASKTPPSASSLGFHVGLGTRIFFSPALALRLEVKDYVYRAEVPNMQKRETENQLFTEIGLSFFFPFSNRAQP